jgi:peroxiredoxin Q/BCP
MLKPGDKAPDFKLPGTSGRESTLKDYRGRKLVLYFYPKDQTPGCTREACDFKDNFARVRRAGTEVVGVSKDSLASHDRFREKYSLPFDLLSDGDNAVATAYGAYGEKTMYGKKVMGTIRSTFIIDEKGKIERVWSPVKVNGHVDQVLAALKGEAAPAGKKSAGKKVTKKKAPRKK